MNPILIVEDDADINQLVATLLKAENYPVQQAYSGSEAKLLLNTEKYSLAILDLMLPGVTGEALIAHIRAHSNMPVIILSAKDTKLDKVNLLRLGADDYITKPFDGEELIARIQALFRRTQHAQNQIAEVLSFKNVQLYMQTRVVTVQGMPVSLTAREFDILKLMLQNPHKVFTKANLYKSVWNDEFLGDDNTINVHVSNLRTKLKNKDFIQTVWGIGFKLQD